MTNTDVMPSDAGSTATGLDIHVWAGVQALIDDYARIGPDDDVVIVYTPDSREAAAWTRLALVERGHDPAIVDMAPLRDPGFGARLSSAVPPHRDGVGRCVLLIFELHTMSHNRAVKHVLRGYRPEQYDVVRAINSGADLFRTGLAVHPKELSARNTTILEHCRTAHRMVITTDGGSHLDVELDNDRFRWLSNRGFGQPGKFLIIPSGEVATFPAQIDGTFVADFAINVNMFYAGDVRLAATPVKVEIRDGALANFTCADPNIARFLDKCFARPNATKVGELGLGTNTAVQVAVAEDSHLNERVPGVHIGFGQHNQSDAVTGYGCDVHIDLCAASGRIWFDGSEECMDLTTLTGSTNPHPTLLASEDVFSDDAEEDCCGLLS